MALNRIENFRGQAIEIDETICNFAREFNCTSDSDVRIVDSLLMALPRGARVYDPFLHESFREDLEEGAELKFDWVSDEWEVGFTIQFWMVDVGYYNPPPGYSVVAAYKKRAEHCLQFLENVLDCYTRYSAIENSGEELEDIGPSLSFDYKWITEDSVRVAYWIDDSTR